MNLVFWALQIILAIKFLSVAYTHGLRPGRSEMQSAMERLGAAARPLLIVVALSTFAGALALVLPAAAGLWTGLVPWAAAMLSLMMLGAIGFHVACREEASVVPGFVLLALAAFVAYGRWVMVPL